VGRRNNPLRINSWFRITYIVTSCYLASILKSELEQVCRTCFDAPDMNTSQRTLVKLIADSKTRSAKTRRPIFRIYEIHAAISAGTYPNCSQLAAQLSVQRKTIQRDITFMRDELKLPLVYDDSMHGYYYRKDVSHFPVFQTTIKDLAGLFLARTALESIRGTALAHVLNEVFERITHGILGEVQFSWGDLDEAFTRKTTEANTTNVELFGKIAHSVLNQHIANFYYRKLGEEQFEARRVHPLHLGQVEGGWYLIAHDLERNALRTFALPRISRYKVVSTHFDRPEGFDGSEHLKRSFGIWNVDGDQTQQLVRVELRDYAARLAQERRWHPTQEVEALNTKGTRVEVRFEVGRLEEVLRWVLSFGRQAKVIGPPELVSMVLSEVKAMQE